MKNYIILQFLSVAFFVVLLLGACKAQRTITTQAKAVPCMGDSMLIETQVVETYDGIKY